MSDSGQSGKTNQSETTAVLQMAESIFKNIGCYRRIQSIDLLCKEHIYFEICKIMLSEKYMQMIKEIERKSCDQAEKIQDLINIFAMMIGDNLQHITGTEIIKGNLNHIYNLLQVLEYFSGYMDGEHSQFNIRVPKQDQSSSRKSWDRQKPQPNFKNSKDLYKVSKRPRDPKLENPAIRSEKRVGKQSKTRYSNIRQIYAGKRVQNTSVENISGNKNRLEGAIEKAESHDIRTGNLSSFMRMNLMIQELERERNRVFQEQTTRQIELISQYIVDNTEKIKQENAKLNGYLRSKLDRVRDQSSQLKVNKKKVIQVLVGNVLKSKSDVRTQRLYNLRKQKEQLEQLVEFDWGSGQKLLQKMSRMRKNSSKPISKKQPARMSQEDMIVQ